MHNSESIENINWKKKLRTKSRYLSQRKRSSSKRQHEGKPSYGEQCLVDSSNSE